MKVAKVDGPSLASRRRSSDGFKAISRYVAGAFKIIFGVKEGQWSQNLSSVIPESKPNPVQ